jgi:hypothetical protein
MSQDQMPAEDNKLIVARFWNEVFEGGELDVADEIFAADWVLQDDREAGFYLPDASQGPEAAKKLANDIREYFSDHFQVEIEDQAAAEGDRVVTRFAINATRDGTPVDVKGMSISQVSGDKIAWTRLYWESGLMYQQLGYFRDEEDIKLCRPPWRCK